MYSQQTHQTSVFFVRRPYCQPAQWCPEVAALVFPVDRNRSHQKWLPTERIQLMVGEARIVSEHTFAVTISGYAILL
jgi:hypothetical protein